MPQPDTIVAIATPQGRGGIGVVRISGPESADILHKLSALHGELASHRARYTFVVDELGERIDGAVVTYYQSPHSYTGDDVVEISAHGSPVVLEWIVRRAVELGARPARPGEFTERAFLNRRIDLTQAEAVRDLIDAQTLEQARVAAEQVGGSLAAKIRPAKDELVRLIAELEAGIDFAEDDIDTLPTSAIAPRLEAVREPMEALLATFAYGNVLHSGVKLAIVGRPNAGKSSLFNRLVERDRAIVTAIAGTTRDVVSERVSIGGVPVELMDTAGLREATDEVERIGIERSEQAIADADVVLVVWERTGTHFPEAGHGAPGELAGQQDDLLERLAGRSYLLVENKVDLLQLVSESASQQVSGSGIHQVSAKTGAGIAELREAIVRAVTGGAVRERGGVLTNLRQRAAVERCVDGLKRAEEACVVGIPHEMILLDVYDALRGMDELTGDTTADDVLGLIFSTFCIGK